MTDSKRFLSSMLGPVRRVATRRVLGRFARNRSGSVALLFGLSLIPLTAIVGLAVDYGRVYAVRSHTQAALDAAALAAGRVAQVEDEDTLQKASAAATAYFNQTKPDGVVSTEMEFSPNDQATEFTVTATSWVRTPFLGVLQTLFHRGAESSAPSGCQSNYFGCIRVITTATAALCPSAACGGSSAGGTDVEVALMLDVTGSMCSPCSKIDALKSAAKDLIDIVVWDEQDEYTSKVALAPFAEAVNVGTVLAPKVRGNVSANSSSSPQTLDVSTTSSQPTSKWVKFDRPDTSTPSGCTSSRGGGRGSSRSYTCTWQISSKCVTERIGAQAYTDAPPSTAFVGKGYFGTDADSSCGVANYTDPETNSIQPLTADKTLLKRRIDKLSTGGSTAGHLGTAWAYYLLSPNWGYLFPSESAPAPYSDLSVTNSNGMPKLRKIAVLMTDGEYNINYCKGVEAKNSDQSPDINCNSENGKSLPQATSLCTAIKNSKIEVFTVGFQVSSSSRNFLSSCATDASHYYDAKSEIELQAAFRDIALKIATLRLTN